jgi:hypothetical protein
MQKKELLYKYLLKRSTLVIKILEKAIIKYLRLLALLKEEYKGPE